MLFRIVHGGGGTSLHLRSQECPLMVSHTSTSLSTGIFTAGMQNQLCVLWRDLLAEPEQRHFVPVFSHLSWVKTCWLVAEEGIFSPLLVIINQCLFSEVPMY